VTAWTRGPRWAATARPLGDGAGNRLLVPNPAPGDYYLFVDGATGQRRPAFVLTARTSPPARVPQRPATTTTTAAPTTPRSPAAPSLDDTTETGSRRAAGVLGRRRQRRRRAGGLPPGRGLLLGRRRGRSGRLRAGRAVLEFPEVAGFVVGDSSTGSNRFAGSCGGNNAPETIYRFTLRHNANLTFSIQHEETIMNTLLYVRQGECTNARSERGCAGLAPDPRGGGGNGQVDLDRAAPGEYFVFVDNPLRPGRPLQAVGGDRAPARRLQPISFDNDGDGLIDGEDLGCADPDDEDERDPAEEPVCFNGLDDDGDGLADYPSDPGCIGKGADDEVDPRRAPPPAPTAVDDDEDEAIDYPADAGCASARGDTDEADPAPRPGAATASTTTATTSPTTPTIPAAPPPVIPARPTTRGGPSALRTSSDNDRDGLVDFPFDPGCSAAGHGLRGAGPRSPGGVQQRIDDDADGRVDFPRDPGCSFAADSDEADPAFAAPVRQPRDDDRNGRIDFPDDPGCRFAADTTRLRTRAPPAPLRRRRRQRRRRPDRPGRRGLRAAPATTTRPIPRARPTAPTASTTTATGSSTGPTTTAAPPRAVLRPLRSRLPRGRAVCRGSLRRRNPPRHLDVWQLGPPHPAVHPRRAGRSGGAR
jgi:hypothetical protein